MKLRADLHLHSCLSACAALEMSPAAMARSARAAGLDVVAITDHNSARNAPAFAEACRRCRLHALFGVEATTVEELHVLCIFDRVAAAVEFGERMTDCLPPILNRPAKMGDQPVVDFDENILEEIPVYLGAATGIPLTELVAMAAGAGGLVIPAHIDRPSGSLLSQLGAIPDLPYDALEVTPAYPRNEKQRAETHGRPLIFASDAHFLRDIGRRHIVIDCPRFDLHSVRQALAGARPVVRDAFF